MEEQKKQGQTLTEEELRADAKLLSEAVIELNLSKRSVGLYPPGHVVITGAIKRCYKLLQKVFKIRPSITLGITREALVIDGNTLDPKNPVFGECAQGFHEKGIASMTFSAGLSEDEIVRFHELLTARNAPTGQELAEVVPKNGISHLSLAPIDFASFKFVEGTVRPEGVQVDIWDDYVHGMLEGKLAGGKSAGEVVDIVPPESIAEIINREIKDEPSEDDSESYERVVGAYVGKRGQLRLRSESLKKLFLLVDKLTPAIRDRFLAKTYEHFAADQKDLEKVLNDMTSANFNEVVKAFSDYTSHMPVTLRKVIDRLADMKSTGGFEFDVRSDRAAIVDDVELGTDLISLFDEKPFDKFTSSKYREELWSLLDSRAEGDRKKFKELKRQLSVEFIDHCAAEVMVELLETTGISKSDYMNVLTRLTELAMEMAETGRFEELLNIYVVMQGQSYGGRFRTEAESTIKYYFHTEEFVDRIVEAGRLTGSGRRVEFIRLIKAMRVRMIPRLLDALADEQSAAVRKHLLGVLVALGSDMVPEAKGRLKDERWYVVRNMIYLLRHCGSKRDAEHVRKFSKHEDSRVCTEAVMALLHFKAPDAVPLLKVHVKSENEELRKSALNLVGSYRLREAVPVLIELLEKRDILGAGAYDKIPVVQALARIGDGRAIGPLIEILNSKALLYRGGLDDLKKEIFQNVNRYQLYALKPLVEAGRRSGNEEIRSTSETLYMNLFMKKERNSDAD